MAEINVPYDNNFVKIINIKYKYYEEEYKVLTIISKDNILPEDGQPIKRRRI